MLVDEQGQVLSVVRGHVEQQSRTLIGPEAQRDVLSSQRHVGVDGGRPGAAVPHQLVRLLEGEAHGRGGLEGGRHLWRKEVEDYCRCESHNICIGLRDKDLEGPHHKV